jgi:hypothetical protein
MQHRTLLENIKDHQGQAKDERYRQLCSRYLPKLEEHQRMLDDYQTAIGAAGGASGGVKEAVGAVLGKARSVVDAARESDFLRVVGDVVEIRQSQDTFATFATAGEQLGEPRLSEIGRHGAQEHEQMARDFNNLVQELFVEHARQG